MKMAGVDLTISETLDGVQITDALSAGGTGTNLDQVTNSSYSPLVNKTNNQGRQDWYIRHNATVDPITDCKIHLQAYGTGTGYSYGGPAARSAAADYTAILAEGTASGTSKNNNDGLSSGLWIEMNVVQMISETNQFDVATRGGGALAPDADEVVIFENTVGNDLANAVTISKAAAVIDSDQSLGGNASAGYVPTAPVDGQLGIDGDTALGDNFHLGWRIYLRSSFANGGVYQIEAVVVYTFTA
jgi:hypothetical protein